jgi:hypothetical protein
VRETTPDERHEIMYKLIKERGKPIDFDALVLLYSEYQKRELMARYDDADPDHMKDIERMAEFYCKLGRESFVHDYPAIDYLLKNKR